MTILEMMKLVSERRTETIRQKDEMMERLCQALETTEIPTPDIISIDHQLKWHSHNIAIEVFRTGYCGFIKSDMVLMVFEKTEPVIKWLREKLQETTE